MSYSFLTVEIYTSRMYLILMCRAVSIYEKKDGSKKVQQMAVYITGFVGRCSRIREFAGNIQSLY